MSTAIDDILRVMNEALDADPEAITKLVEKRVECNQKLVEHPTIRCAKSHPFQSHTIGLMGILNGIAGEGQPGFGPICASVSEGRIVGFMRTPPQ